MYENRPHKQEKGTMDKKRNLEGENVTFSFEKDRNNNSIIEIGLKKFNVNQLINDSLQLWLFKQPYTSSRNRTTCACVVSLRFIFLNIRYIKFRFWSVSALLWYRNVCALCSRLMLALIHQQHVYFGLLPFPAEPFIPTFSALSRS